MSSDSLRLVEAITDLVSLVEGWERVYLQPYGNEYSGATGDDRARFDALDGEVYGLAVAIGLQGHVAFLEPTFLSPRVRTTTRGNTRLYVPLWQGGKMWATTGIIPAWRSRLEGLRAAAVAIGRTQGEATSEAAAAVDRREGAGDEKPKVYLFGWVDILNAVGVKYGEDTRKMVSRLNDLREGPITKPKTGRSPTVEKFKLIAWWNRLDLEHEAAENQKAGRRLDAESQHAYGRQATVAPGVGGAVKKRRKDKKP